ncbi:MAG: tRNA (adenosine(37)-N6)-threonylcarbamoyltransferase complex transferase subunit TsaD [Polyangiales bacterium]
MRVLGIESSCDETAAAVVDEHGHVFADEVASQVKLHAPFGGVVPELASRAHMENIAAVVDRALAAVPGGLDAVDAVSVTRGPGLVGALLVGMQFAKAFAWSRGLPLVGVSHLEGHLLAGHLVRPGDGGAPPVFPYVALLVSGGHTALYAVRGPDDIELLGQTRDDAAGEAFDKVAKLLGLGYPGGPVVDRLAATGDTARHDFPRPLPQRDSLEFSFSGLKTAVAQFVRTNGVPTDEASLADVCASFQRVVVETLVRKALAACAQTGFTSLVITGGVAANRGLRTHAATECARAGVTVVVPPFASCTDNAAMIAYAGALRLVRGERHGIDMAPFSRDPGFRRGKVREARESAKKRR